MRAAEIIGHLSEIFEDIGMLHGTCLQPDTALPRGTEQDELNNMLARIMVEHRFGFRLSDTDRRQISLVQDYIEILQRRMTVSGLSDKEIVHNFESLGDNCEFGFVQHVLGYETLDLFRFSGGLSVPTLLRGLHNEFGDLDDLQALSVENVPGQTEHYIANRSHGLAWHTHIHQGTMPVDELRRKMSERLRYQKGKFLENLVQAGRIYVIRRLEPLTLADVYPAWQELRRRGPNTLLWVVPHDADHPAGSVEVVEDGLFQGFIDRFAPLENAEDSSFDGWLQLCHAAWHLRVSAKTA